MQNKKLNELAEALAAQAITADSDLAGDADEGVFEGLRLIAQASNDSLLPEVVERASELLGGGPAPALGSATRSHRILACLAVSGAYSEPGDDEVLVPFSIPMCISGFSSRKGPAFRRGSLKAVSEVMSSRFEYLDVLLVDDLYSGAELSALAELVRAGSEPDLALQIAADASARPDWLSAKEIYETPPVQPADHALHAFCSGVIKARDQSHFLTCLVMHYDGPEIWDWFDEPFVDAWNNYFVAGCDDEILVDFFNPALLPFAAGSVQAREIARVCALRARRGVGESRYQKARRPGRPKRRVLTYDFRSRATGQSMSVTADFRALPDELANDDLEIVFEQELFRWGFREEDPYG